VNPNRVIEVAICRICFLEWVRALRGYGLSCAGASISIEGCLIIASADSEA
jgi:hypothetical protein